MVFRQLRLRQTSRTTGSMVFGNALVLVLGCTLVLPVYLCVPAPIPAWAAEASNAAETRRHYAIPAGTLADALARFAAAAGVPLSFDPKILDGRTSPGLQGEFTIHEGFAQLLAGSGFVMIDTGNGLYALHQVAGAGAMTLDPVTVEGSAGTQNAYGPVQGYLAKHGTSGTKTDTPIVEVPQTINVVTADQIAATKAQTLQGALAYTPGILAQEGSDHTGDAFSIRGFEATSSTGSIYRDGSKYGANVYDGQQEPYGLERVEVLKGAASILYGAAAPGGIVNTMTKRPVIFPLREINVEYGSYDHKQVSADLGGALTEDGTWSYRLTGLKRDSDTFIDHVKDDRTYIAPALTWSPDDRTSLTFLNHYQKNHSAYIYGLPPEVTILPNASGRVSSTTFVGEPGYDHADSTILSSGYLFEHAFSDNLKLRNGSRYIRSDLDMPSMWISGVASDGRTTLYRGAQDRKDVSTAATTDTSLEIKWRTGMVEHISLAGLDYTRQFHSTRRYNRDGENIDLYAPAYGTVLGTAAEASYSSLSEANQLGVYAQNQMKIADKVVLLLGGRQAWAEDRTTPYFGERVWTRQSSEAFTGRAGLVYLFDNGVAPFVSYSESFEPEIGTNRYGEAFKPTTGQQYEFGVRYQPPGIDAMISGTVYRLTRQNVTTPDPVDSNYSVQTGEVRSRGFELEIKGEVASHFNIAGGYAYSDARITKSNDATELGRRYQAIPYNQFSLWGDYNLAQARLPEVTAGAGMRFIDSTLPMPSLSGTVPSYTVFDAMVRYDLDKLWRFTINATNLFDKEYIASCTYGCFFGERRKVIGTLSYRW